jgi:hypothetical protein
LFLSAPFEPRTREVVSALRGLAKLDNLNWVAVSLGKH